MDRIMTKETAQVRLERTVHRSLREKAFFAEDSITSIASSMIKYCLENNVGYESDIR